MPDQGDKIDFNPSEIKSEKREDVLSLSEFNGVASSDDLE